MTDIPDWKKAIDRGTSMHTILAEKKSAEGPDWMKTPEYQLSYFYGLLLESEKHLPLFPPQ